MRGRLAAAAATMLLAAPAQAHAGLVQEAGSPYQTGQSPYGAIPADFDQDGWTDLAVVAGDSSDITMLFRLPFGVGFGGEPSPHIGSGPNFGAAADFNGDGYPDIAAGSYNTSNEAILLRAPGGAGFTVEPNTPIAIAGRPAATVAADFDGNGKPDIAVAGWQTANVSILLRNSAGTAFTLEGTPSVGGNPRQIAVGDFNGDGRPDLAVANSGSASVSVLLRQSTGGFAAEGTAIPVGADPEGIATGDFNGDGRPDIAVTDASVGTVRVLLRQPAGGFVQDGNSELTGNGANGVAVADFDRDGILDLAVANAGDKTVSIVRRLPSGWRADAAISTPPGAYHVAVADFDRDGRPDLAVTGGSGSTQTTILVNPAPPVLPVPPVIVADADHDGVVDAADNCPTQANADQKDTDGDHIGDACEVLPPGNLPPVAGVRTVVRTESGTVLVKLPSSGTFVPLAGVASLPVGATVDARQGTVALRSAANRKGTVASASVAAGIFRIKQQRARGTKTVTTDLVLGTPPGQSRACASSKFPRKGVVRTLKVTAAKGVFRAVAAKGVIRGAKASWTTSDRCDGTLTTVTRGKVAVKAGKKKTRTVRAGHSLLIKARLFAAKQRRG